MEKWSSPVLTWRGALTAFAIALLVGIFAWCRDNLSVYRANQSAIQESYKVLSLIDDLNERVSMMEVHHRGYLISGRDEELAHFDAAVNDIRKKYGGLLSLTAGSPQQERALKVKPLLDEVLGELTEMAELRRTRGFAKTLGAYAKDRGEEELDHVRLGLALVKSEEFRLIQARAKVSDSYAQKTWWVASGGAFVLFVLLAFAVVLIERDGRRRRRIETALRLSEQRLRDILDFSPAVVYVKGLDGRFRMVNRKFARLFGIDPGQAEGRHASEVLHPEAAAVIHLHEDEALECEHAIRSEQPLPNGETYYCVKFALRTAKGDPYAVCCFGVDITEQKNAERTIRKLNETLEHRVAHRTAQLEQLNAELEAFAYSVSHDLRAPLRGIDGFSQVLQKRYATALDAEGLGYLDRVRAATQRMGQLIEDLLNLSRVSRRPLHVAGADLSRMAKEILDELQRAHPERKVETVVQPGVTANADERLLRIALENLLANAWKFTSKTENARIEFGREQENGKARYYVKDNGAGFDMAYADKLFVPFQRLHSSKEFPGTGIGLATVQRIIRRHEGDLTAMAAVGQGAKFLFELGEPEEDTGG